MKHEDIWRAIDTLAAEHGLSPSGLARLAGLDPTTFNPSKRKLRDGRLRWPSTESVSKVLTATGADLEAFTALVTGARALPAGGRALPAPGRRLPLLALSEAGKGGYFDESGYPTGAGWDEVGAPEVNDPHAYALEIVGDIAAPVFRDGDIVIASPAAPIRRGDRVIVRTCRGEVMPAQLQRRSARRVDLLSLNPAAPAPSSTFELADLAWMHRIIWASQ